MILSWRIACWAILVPGMFISMSCSYAENDVGGKCEKPKLDSGEMYFQDCKPIDAFERVKVLAKTGDLQALYMLGKVYQLGGDSFGLYAVKRDTKAAERYFLSAAEKGYAPAQAQLGFIYSKFYQDTRASEGMYWYCRAAMQDNYMATVNIQTEIDAEDLKESVRQYCEPILKTPPKPMQ